MEDGIGGSMNVVIAISGRGSNMEALLDYGVGATTILSNSHDTLGLRLARKRGIKCVVGDTVQDICHAIERLEPDLVCLAGFMRILPQYITQKFPMMNIHPSLLPRFPGLHAQRQALEANAQYSGCTVHMVDGGVDTGKIILQKAVRVMQNDTVESLSDRILELEHEAYVQAVRMFMERSMANPIPRCFCQRFKDSDKAIEFALSCGFTLWPPQTYMWKLDNHTMVSKEPPELVPHVVATQYDGFDVLRHRLDNLVDWNRIPAVSKPGIMLAAE